MAEKPLTYEALVADNPWLAAYEGQVQQWINLAPAAIDPKRFVNVAQAQRLYVLHSVVHFNAPHRVATNADADLIAGREVVKDIPAHSAPRPPATARDRRRVRAMSVWGTTAHGHALHALAKY